MRLFVHRSVAWEMRKSGGHLQASRRNSGSSPQRHRDTEKAKKQKTLSKSAGNSLLVRSRSIRSGCPVISSPVALLLLSVPLRLGGEWALLIELFRLRLPSSSPSSPACPIVDSDTRCEYDNLSGSRGAGSIDG